MDKLKSASLCKRWWWLLAALAFSVPWLVRPVADWRATYLAHEAAAAAEKADALSPDEAARRGNADALLKLSQLHEAAWRGNADALRKVGQIRAAARHEDTDTLIELGVLYDAEHVSRFPLLIVKNADEALRGDPRSQFWHGMIYFEGVNVRKDYGQAMAWFRKSAEQGDAYGQFFTGRMYAEGKGARKDAKQAYFWLLLADKQDLREIEGAWNGKDFDRIHLALTPEDQARLLTPEQRAAIQAKVSEWKPKR